MHLAYHDLDPHVAAASPIDSGETGAPEAGIEITAEMIEAGLNTLYCFHITEPEEDEMREAVTEVFKAMLGAM